MCAAVKVSRLGKFDLNPRGNLWLKDENRFGHKLLSKMGWSQGKGLGKNEDGIAENLKVKVKSGNTGVGWSDKVPLADENEEYDAVLANLNEKFNSSENKSKKEDNVKSLEARSQQFKKRLHYGKFVRGKDVCRYSEKDMNSIFVSKKPKSEPTLTRVKSTVTNIDSSSTDDEAPETTPTFKSQLSMKEYFAMKMKNKPGNTMGSNNTKETEETSEKENSNKKKGKNKKLKLDPQTSNESSTAGEALKCDFSSIETVDAEEPNVKKETSSKKRIKVASIEKSKRLKLDPDLVEEYSNANGFTGKESDDIAEVSHCGSELSKISGSTVEDEDQNEVMKEGSKKKEKKNVLKKAGKRKRADTEVVDISEEATSPESSEKELQDDLVVLGEFPQPEVQVLGKKRKKLLAKRLKKQKSGTLTKLKTCLKGSWNYSLDKESRKVSFNEHVFYRTIASDAEGEIKSECPNETDVSESVICLTTDERMDDKSTTDESIDDKSTTDESMDGKPTTDESIDDKPTTVKAENIVESSGNTYVHIAGACNVETEADKTPNCMNLPKCEGSNYNSWLENQRIATKMKLYQNMVKKIKKHPVLKTSNILDIKGYGNWGF